MCNYSAKCQDHEAILFKLVLFSLYFHYKLFAYFSNNNIHTQSDFQEPVQVFTCGFREAIKTNNQLNLGNHPHPPRPPPPSRLGNNCKLGIFFSFDGPGPPPLIELGIC